MRDLISFVCPFHSIVAALYYGRAYLVYRVGLGEKMKDSDPLVSVIIPNLNGEKLLPDCLSSLRKQEFKDFETIIVDNGSTDGSINFIRQSHHWVDVIIENKENLGFARACNQGIMASRGKFIALLNNDTEAHPEWLKQLVAAAERYPEIGMFASKTLFFDRRNIIDTTGHLMYPDGLNRGRGRLEVDLGQYDDKVDVFFPSGCAGFYRREVFDDIGLFDENHFAYGDDTDIGLRARLAGWGCVFVPKAVVYHKYSMTTGEYSPEKVFLVERNRIWIVWKYFPLKMIILSFFYSFLRYILQGYGAVFKKGAAGRFASRYSTPKLISVVLKAYFSALIGLPRVVKERKGMRKLCRVPKSEIDRWFKDYRMSVFEISLKR